MLNIRPSFYDDFKCIAEKCTDSCCVGWEIAIDKYTLANYNNMNTEFGEKIRKNITTDECGDAIFRLDENERCPFLNKNNLCDIITNCGEESICYICKEHPRFYNEFAEATEYGLGLCCEEVCRCLLENDEPVSFIVEEDGTEDFYTDDENEKELYKALYELREEFYKALASDLSYNDKVRKIVDLSEKYLNKNLEPDRDDKILARYKETEPINKEWTEYFNELNNNICEILGKEKPFDEASNGDKKYSKILAYIIFRHLMKSIFPDTASFGEYLNFCISGVRFIKLCDIKTFIEKGELTLKDRIDNVKRWSKQIEYSEENIDLLTFEN